MQRGIKLISNISINFLTQFILFIVAFLLTPQIYNRLGPTFYGILVLLNTVIIYFTIFDFGLISALIKFVAEYRASKQNLNNLINTILFIFSCLIIILLIIINIFASVVIKHLNIPPLLQNETIILLRYLSLSFFFGGLSSFFSAISQAFHRFDIYNIKNFIAGFFIPVISLVLLFLNKGLREIIYCYIIINLCTAFIFYLFTFKLIPNYKIGFSFSLPLFKKVFSFGFFKFISTLSSRIVAQLNEILIGFYLPVKNISYYSIPSAIAQKISEIVPNISLPLFPLSSELNSLSLNNKISVAFYRSTKLVNIIISPIAVFIFVFSNNLLSAWIGPEFAFNANLILKILTIAYFINSFAGIGSSIIDGLGKTKTTAFFSILSSLFYLILALILLPKYGLFGAALSILINSIIQVPLFLIYSIKKYIGFINYIELFRIYFLPPIIACFTIFPFLFLAPKSILLSLYGLIFLFLIYLLLCFVVLWFIHIDNDDKKIINSFISTILKTKH